MADAEPDTDVTMPDAGTGDAADADPLDESGNSDTESGDDLSDDIDGGAPAKSLEERLAEALVQKDSGNVHFKAGENTAAEKAYRDALSALGKLDSSAHAAESGGPEAEARKLFLSLHLNLSAVRLKLESWPDAARSAREALAIESNSPKARYRLGVALSRMGEFPEAKSLLVAVCKEDAKNKAARRELADLKERAKARAAEEKARMANMFAAGGKSLYADKEEERELKAREAEAKKKREADAAAAKDAKLHEDWDKECERREAASEAPVTFEDFKKAADEEEKKEKEEREKKRKAKEEAREKAKREAREAARRQREADGHVVRVDDEDDLKGVNLRGYKKKADGETTTSFFDREISSSERALIGDIAPQKITASSPEATAASGRRKSGVGSDWNQAGQTWEDKDVTDWATSTLKAKLATVRSSCGGVDLEKDPGKLLDAFKGADMGMGAGEADGSAGVDDTMAKLGALSTSLARIEAEVTEVKTLTGDASVAIIRGTKRALFNLEAELKWSATMDLSLGGLGGGAGEDGAQGRSQTFRGTMKLPELSSSAMGEANASTGEAFEPVTTFSKKAGPRTPEERKRLDEALSALKAEMAATVARFMEEMKER